MLDAYDLNQLQTILSYLKSTTCETIDEALVVISEAVSIRATGSISEQMPQVTADKNLICNYHIEQRLTYHPCSGGWHDCPICHWSPEMP
jgi:hypothetical protein